MQGQAPAKPMAPHKRASDTHNHGFSVA